MSRGRLLLLLATGLGVIALGLGMVWPPLGVIAAGGSIVAVAMLTEYRR